MKSVIADYRYRTMCLRIAPKVGPTIRITRHPRNLTMSNDEVYLTGSGYDFTGYSAGSGLAPAMVDLEGIAGIAGINRDQLSSGLYDNARAYLFATSWRAPIEDEEPIVASILGKTTLMDDRYRIEEMALIDALNQSVGRTYTAACPYTLFDTHLGQATLLPYSTSKCIGPRAAPDGPLAAAHVVTGTLTGITSPYVFRDSARAEAADYFGAGAIRFTSGDNAGLPPKEIRRYEADGTIEIFEPFHYALTVGDEYEMLPGCRKRLEDCRDKWDNVINYGGDLYVPVGSKYQEIGTK